MVVDLFDINGAAKLAKNLSHNRREKTFKDIPKKKKKRKKPSEI
jgi:hypothetical protein